MRFKGIRALPSAYSFKCLALLYLKKNFLIIIAKNRLNLKTEVRLRTPEYSKWDHERILNELYFNPSSIKPQVKFCWSIVKTIFIFEISIGMFLYYYWVAMFRPMFIWTFFWDCDQTNRQITYNEISVPTFFVWEQDENFSV